MQIEVTQGNGTPVGVQRKEGLVFQRGKNGFIEKGALRLALRGSYAVRDGV